jgi:hypothetical protein
VKWRLQGSTNYGTYFKMPEARYLSTIHPANRLVALKRHGNLAAIEGFGTEDSELS